MIDLARLLAERATLVLAAVVVLVAFVIVVLAGVVVVVIVLAALLCDISREREVGHVEERNARVELGIEIAATQDEVIEVVIAKLFEIVVCAEDDDQAFLQGIAGGGAAQVARLPARAHVVVPLESEKPARPGHRNLGGCRFTRINPVACVRALDDEALAEVRILGSDSDCPLS